MSDVGAHPDALPRPRARKTKHDACGCAYEIDRLLATRGERLVTAIQLKRTPRRVFVATEKKDGAKPRPNFSLLAVNYCPFCGTKVPITP